MLRDMGVECGITVLTDSSAAVGISSRTGLGKVRHLEVNLLWVQRAVREKLISLVKVPGPENLADIGSKYWEAEVLRRLMPGMGLEFKEGRAETAPELGIVEQGWSESEWESDEVWEGSDDDNEHDDDDDYHDC